MPRSPQALEQGSLTVGFLGGSISDGRTPYSWPEAVVAGLVAQFPDRRIVVENAAIGATGSDLAALRAQRDIIVRNCDLVLVEYAANDQTTPTEQRMRSREGLLRQLLGAGCDVVLAHTFCPPQYDDMIAGRVPPSIAEFETLAEHYDLNSVWMGLHALREVLRGDMTWQEWLPDGIHPQYRGSWSYARPVRSLLQEVLSRESLPPAPEIELPPPPASTLPSPLNPRNWETARPLDWSAVSWQGPWSLRRDPTTVWMGQVLQTNAPGASLSFEWEGRGLCLGFDFGTDCGDFRWRIDGGHWQAAELDRPDWVGIGGWFRTYLPAQELSPGRHRFELETLRASVPRCTGNRCTLALIGALP